jgi:quercetin dioxygenase-like cupin family protein
MHAAASDQLLIVIQGEGPVQVQGEESIPVITGSEVKCKSNE